MDFFTSETLAPYALNLKLTDSMLEYIAARMNSGEKLSLMQIALEIQNRFKNETTKKLTPKGRPIIYSDICLLCLGLSQDGHGQMLEVNLKDCIFIANLD
ncbi:hypothetical protein [Staphylococcus agnetis]|uniref:hypothetical protein n=1 Tax=Staphylococcus agnetis TaxID=985762 RepID=UPI0021D0534B|nr:hypothetical protein [Staphylococcus agnetis]UXU60243.1 hypothetical protein MUA97_03610 [Staphylococcus agnetis]UXU62574.1 hypothetical protein MUA43_03610 [Staphylococcus agnetis]UXU65158.1 hypothetical protein MUA84_05285 [Staphylococcus agnetis]